MYDGVILIFLVFLKQSFYFTDDSENDGEEDMPTFQNTYYIVLYKYLCVMCQGRQYALHYERIYTLVSK